MVGRIILDGISYPCQQISESLISPWLGRIGASSSLYANLGNTERWVMESWAGGFGTDFATPFEGTAGFYNSTLWTHIRGFAMLPPLKNTGTITGAPNVTINLIRDFVGTLYAGGVTNVGTARPLYTLSGTTWTSVTTAGAPAIGEDVWDIRIVEGSTYYMLVAMGGTADFYRFDGTTWGQPAAGKKYNRFCPHRSGKIMGASLSGTQITVDYSDDVGVTWTNIGYIHSAGAPTSFTLQRDEKGELYGRLTTREAVLRVYPDSLEIRPDYHFTNIGEGNGKGCQDFSPAIPLERHGMIELYADGRVVDVGLERESIVGGVTPQLLTGPTGLPILTGLGGSPFGNTRHAQVNSIYITNNWMYVVTNTRNSAGTLLFSGNRATAFIVNLATKTWHYMAEATANDTDLHAVYYDGVAGRLWFWQGNYGAATTPYYIDFFEDNFAPDKVTGASEASGAIITPWFNGGFWFLQKILIGLQAFGRNVSSTHTIRIEYVINEQAQASFTDVGTNPTWNAAGPRLPYIRLTSGTAPSELLGVAHDRIRLRITVANTDGSPLLSTGPQLDHLVVDYAAVPQVLRSWRLRVFNRPDVAGEKVFPVSTHAADNFHEALTEACLRTQLVAYYPEGDHKAGNIRYFVKPSTYIYVAFPGEPEGGAAYADLIVTEIIQSNGTI